MRPKLKPLFIFELANNHNGNLQRGIKIISEIKEQVQEYKKYFDFAFKLQYRNLDTFIHPEHKKDSEVNFVKRFEQTKLNPDEILTLKNEIKKQGFIAICTAFDEDSVDIIEAQNYDFIKIASCSFSDRPLLEKIATKNLPIIASTAGMNFEEINMAVKFFANQNKSLSLMHCVAQYPTNNDNLQLNQIDLLKSKYPELIIGYSTHEDPENFDSIKIAIAKGAEIFEKHVGLDDYDGSINDYSATPKQIGQWIKSAKDAFDACGVSDERYEFTQEEKISLQNLTRGVYASRYIKKGEKIDKSNVFMAIPSISNQLLPSDLTNQNGFVAMCDIDSNSAIFFSNVETEIKKVNVTIS